MPDEKKQIEKIRQFISSHKLAVVSTVSKLGLSQSAVIGFSEAGDLELIFGTFASSRKYVNLQTNPYVSVVIGWDEGKTVQYEGVAHEITNTAEIEEIKKIHLVKIPSAAKFVSKSEERFFKIEPKWIRYTDLSIDPWETWEINFT